MICSMAFYEDSQSYLENAIREAVSFNCASKTINPSNHQTYNYKCSDVKSQLTLLNTLVAFFTFFELADFYQMQVLS